mmetsp:Transcript_62170/g.183815  ORF Transcript_62170/g.183815 Transcript_62170/m.183815 type:complete len:86 (-) Transcript_62170:1507-1764(-)
MSGESLVFSAQIKLRRKCTENGGECAGILLSLRRLQSLIPLGKMHARMPLGNTRSGRGASSSGSEYQRCFGTGSELTLLACNGAS